LFEKYKKFGWKYPFKVLYCKKDTKFSLKIGDLHLLKDFFYEIFSPIY